MSATVGLNIDVILTGQDKVTSGIRSMTGEVERSTSSNVASFGKTRAGVESISNELHKLEGYAKAYIGLSQLGGAAIGIVKIADEYVGLQARLKLATTSQLEFNTANAALFAIAQQNGVPLKESLGLYSKLAPALKELGATQTQTLAMTDLVGKSLRLSGAGAAESASAMLQFSQALGSGVLRGDEFNSLMENSPRLMKAVAEGMNAPISSLRAMAEAGELTADKVVNSLLSQKSKLEEEYSSLPLTVSAAWTKLGNAVTAEVGRLDKAGGGLTGGLAKALGGVADNLDKVSAAFVATGAALATLGIAKAIEASTAYVLALQAERAAAIAVAEAEVMRVRWTYTASVASRAAAAAALVQKLRSCGCAGLIPHQPPRALPPPQLLCKPPPPAHWQGLSAPPPPLFVPLWWRTHFCSWQRQSARPPMPQPGCLRNLSTVLQTSSAKSRKCRQAICLKNALRYISKFLT